MNRKLIGGARQAATAGEADGRVGVSGVLGRLVGRVHARWENGKGLASRLGWLAWAELLVARPSLFISLFPFLFYFSSPLFKFQIDLKFEFKIGVP